MIKPLSPPVAPALLHSLHALNEAHAVELSSVSETKFAAMIAEAFLALSDDAGDALLIAFAATAAYDSPNFLWFRERFARFVYVDRVVVAASRRGEGLALKLYEQLFDAARLAGHDRVACEVNFDPPNPASDRFHERLGFVEAGRTVLRNGKGVRYLAKALKAAFPTSAP